MLILNVGGVIAKGNKADKLIKEILCRNLNYKNIDLLKRYITETGKIVPGRVSGVTSSQQRKITKAIKVARYMALLPYTDSHN